MSENFRGRFFMQLLEGGESFEKDFRSSVKMRFLLILDLCGLEASGACEELLKFLLTNLVHFWEVSFWEKFKRKERMLVKEPYLLEGM